MEKKKLLFALICILAPLSMTYGQDPQQNAETYAKKMGEQLAEFSNFAKSAEIVMDKSPAKGKGCKDCGAKVQNFEEIRTDDKNGILVFISFSMPKAALIELNNQAAKYKARLIMRGIYQNSFIKMKTKILEIEPKGLAIDIDPQLFKQYKIERVPTFVLLKDGKEINRLSGNVTLEFAHEKLVGDSK